MWGESFDPLMVAAGFINFLATFDVNAVTLRQGVVAQSAEWQAATS
jgi:hypothetical protein